MANHAGRAVATFQLKPRTRIRIEAFLLVDPEPIKRARFCADCAGKIAVGFGYELMKCGTGLGAPTLSQFTFQRDFQLLRFGRPNAKIDAAVADYLCANRITPLAF